MPGKKGRNLGTRKPQRTGTKALVATLRGREGIKAEIE
jgi:hypothetical protein